MYPCSWPLRHCSSEQKKKLWEGVKHGGLKPLWVQTRSKEMTNKGNKMHLMRRRMRIKKKGEKGGTIV